VPSSVFAPTLWAVCNDSGEKKKGGGEKGGGGKEKAEHCRRPFRNLRERHGHIYRAISRLVLEKRGERKKRDRTGSSPLPLGRLLTLILEGTLSLCSSRERKEGDA